MPQPARWLSWASAVTSTPRHGRADDHALRTYFTNTYNCCMLAGWVRLARGAVRVAAGRRPASSMRLRRAVTCPTCWPSGGGLASSWMPNAERIPQGMRPGKDCGPSGLGLFGRRELLRCWLLALGRRGLVFSFQRAGKGAFSNQRSVVGQTRDRTRGVLRNGRVERSGWRQVGALLRRGNLAGL